MTQALSAPSAPEAAHEDHLLAGAVVATAIVIAFVVCGAAAVAVICGSVPLGLLVGLGVLGLWRLTAALL